MPGAQRDGPSLCQVLIAWLPTHLIGAAGALPVRQWFFNADSTEILGSRHEERFRILYSTIVGERSNLLEEKI